MTTSYRLSTTDIPRREYRIPDVPANRPIRWLQLGWSDLRAAPAISLTYGAVFAAIGFLLTYLLSEIGLFFLVPVFAAGFFIIAPFLAVGLYSVAKLHSEGKPYSRQAVVRILRRNLASIGHMGIILVLFFLNWIMLSNLLFGGVFHELLPAWGRVRPLPVLLGESLPFLAVFAGVALALAILLFRMTAVALPMLVDEQVDAFNAIFASWRAVGESPAAMSLWAALIFLLTAAGILLFYVGLIVVLPWLAYSGWHAYRDTVVAQ